MVGIEDLFQPAVVEGVEEHEVTGEGHAADHQRPPDVGRAQDYRRLGHAPADERRHQALPTHAPAQDGLVGKTRDISEPPGPVGGCCAEVHSESYGDVYDIDRRGQDLVQEGRLDLRARTQLRGLLQRVDDSGNDGAPLQVVLDVLREFGVLGVAL